MRGQRPNLVVGFSVMATLTRPGISQEVLDPSLPRLATSIPKPFPSNAERLQDELLEELANERVEFDTDVAGPSRLEESSHRPQDTSCDVLVSGIVKQRSRKTY